MDDLQITSSNKYISPKRLDNTTRWSSCRDGIVAFVPCQIEIIKFLQQMIDEEDSFNSQNIID